MLTEMILLGAEECTQLGRSQKGERTASSAAGCVLLLVLVHTACNLGSRGRTGVFDPTGVVLHSQFLHFTSSSTFNIAPNKVYSRSCVHTDLLNE